MLPVAAYRCWPSDTKTFSKRKSQADAAAGELPAQAGLGKQHSARGQVGGSMAPPQCGGAGEGNPGKGSHSSASSAKAWPTDWLEKRGQVNSSRWATAQGTEGRCSAHYLYTAQHCPTLHMPSPLLFLLVNYQPFWSTVRWVCWSRNESHSSQAHRAGEHQISQGTKSMVDSSQSQHSQEIAGSCELRPAPWSCLPGQGTWKQGEKPCLNSHNFSSPSKSKELLRTKAKQHYLVPPRPVTAGRNRCPPTRQEPPSVLSV